MNPYGVSGNIFQSSTDQSANSFSDPLNMAHLYPGWGTNPNYQTPAYDAPYRPAYQGPNPYAAYHKPSFMGGLSQLINPFYTDPYWGNPVDNNQGAFASVAQKPFDAAATVGQRFIAPALTMGVAMKLLKGAGGAFGGGVGAGIASGLGMGGMAAGAMTGLGSMIGAFGIPLAAGMAAANVADAAVFQPYIRTRQMTNTLQDSFHGVSFGDASGNVVTGKGLSGKEASKIASSIDSIGMRDMTFSANQIHGIAGMGMNAGLFDDVNSKGIADRVKSIANQVKMIVSISKDPNVQSAIEEIAKLRMGGASISGGAGSQAMGAYSAMGMHASAAGTTVQRLMQTVGGQGQYMFQMNGMTPYLGQMAAASAFSGFAAAQRTGLMTTGQLARMGGVEGATQSALASQITASSTMFNRMGLVNRYLGGGETPGVVNTVTRFGQLAGGDTMKMMGAMSLYGNQMASKQMGEDGSSGPETQAVQYLQSIGRQPGPNGKYSPSEIATVLKNVMGMPEEQIQAYSSLRASQVDPGTVAQQMKGFGAQGTEQLMQAISQRNLQNTTLVRTWRGIKSGLKSAGDATGEVFGRPVARMAGSATDALESGVTGFFWGNTLEKNKVPIGGEFSDTPQKTISFERVKKNLSDKDVNYKARNRLVRKLRDAASAGGAEGDIARELLAKGMDHPDSKSLFSKFLALQTDPSLKEAYASLDKSGAFFDQAKSDLQGAVVDAAKGDSPLNIETGELQKMTNNKTGMLTDNLLVMGQAQRLYAEFGKDGAKAGLMIQDMLKDPKNAALAKAVSGMSTEGQISYITELTKSGLSGGYRGAARIADQIGMSIEDVMKNPQKFSKDPSVLKALRAAGNDKSAVQKIIGQEISRRNGGAIQGQKVNTGGSLDRSDIEALSAPIDAQADAVSSAAKSSSSQVDWKQYSDVTKAFDGSVKDFAEAVDIFKKVIAGGSGKSSPGFFQNAWGR
jgi:hypothetical protein